MISTLVLVGLALVWAVVLLPDLFAKISSGRKRDTIRSFNSQLSSLGRSAPVQRLGGPSGPLLRSDSATPARRVPPAAAPMTGPLADSTAAPGSSGSNVVPDSNVIDIGSRRRTGAEPVRRTRQVPAGPRAVSPALRKRRQDVLFALGAAALLTLLATVAFGGIFLYVHLLADLLVAAYLIALQQVGASQPVRAREGAAAAGPDHLDPGLGMLGRSSAEPAGLQPRRIAN
ncbi:MAG: hypothetical protein R2716_03010 [Microthrixaceae bacterium]